MSTPHSERLPWFAAGTLHGAQAAEIERHLRGCAECRAEVDALRSMARSLGVLPRDHVAADRLVAYHAGSAELGTEERAEIEQHLGRCPACGSDLAALERADAAQRGARRRRLLGAAASFMLVALAGWQVASWRGNASAVPEVVTLISAQRGAAQTVPAGPCTLRLLLPVLATGSTFVARVEDPSGTSRILGTAAVKAPGDDVVELSVPEGFEPGHHVIFLTPGDGTGSDPYAYPFDVQASP